MAPVASVPPALVLVWAEVTVNHLSLRESLLKSSDSWIGLVTYISLNSKGIRNLEANQAVRSF